MVARKFKGKKLSIGERIFGYGIIKTSRSVDKMVGRKYKYVGPR